MNKKYLMNSKRNNIRTLHIWIKYLGIDISAFFSKFFFYRTQFFDPRFYKPDNYPS